MKISMEPITRDTDLNSLEARKSSTWGLNNHQPLPTMLQQPVPCNTESAYECITSYPPLDDRSDPTLISQDQQSLDCSNMQAPGLPSTYYDESHIGGLYWGAPFAGHDQDTMLFIDPTLSNSSFQTRDTSAQEDWHFESLEDDNQLDKWMNKA